MPDAHLRVFRGGPGDEGHYDDFDVPEFSVGSRDEIGVLATSFNRLRRSLEKAMKLLE